MAAVVAAGVGAALVVTLPGRVASADAPQNKVLARALAIQRGQVQPTKFEMPLSAGVMNALIQSYEAPTIAAALARVNTALAPSPSLRPPSRSDSQGCPNSLSRGDRFNDDGFNARVVTNTRVNQDCSLRRQAEEVVVVNPTDFSNLIAGQNDSRIGFNHCGYDWSLDRGRTWGDTGTAPPPFWQEVLLDGHTADACSDPTATFDHLGNAYVGGIFFDINSPANALMVAKANTGIKGRYYHTPTPGQFQEYTTAPMGKPANDNNPDIFHDKEFIVADSRATSAKKGNVYATWTRFQATNSPIVFSQSVNGGVTWSPQIIISGSAAFCTVGSGTTGDPNACDQDQGSHPVVGADGALYVIFGNGNVPGAGQGQVLMVRCPATNACTSTTDWQGPFRINSLVGTHPTGVAGNAAGCPAGRQCLPPNGYRAPEFTSMTISVDRNSNLYATWADHRNGQAPCLGTLPPATPPCNHDVFYSFSTNGGTTWSPEFTITQRFGNTAQWQPWSDVTGDGNKLQVAFYDRHYGNCEFDGCNDITLATIRNPRSTRPSLDFTRITTASMPNLIPANNPVQAGFLGDYMWVEVSRHSFNQRDVHIVWADTRQLFGPAPEEDVYHARIDD
jgi:hypothetical protein